MLYSILKIPARLAIRIYCRNISINDRSVLAAKGPLLIAANHPNSFLDAIIISTLFKRPVYSLARGDAFTNKLTSAILNSMNILPVYRISEGAENLEQNYHTFSRCREIFKKDGIVLIFSEGRCINEWRLRPLKKGTARLAISSWLDDIDLKIIPTGINYHSFYDFGKNVHLRFGNHISKSTVGTDNGYGKTIQDFNNLLNMELKKLVVELDPGNEKLKKETFRIHTPGAMTWMLLLPASIGYVVHFPLYLPMKLFTSKIASDNGHYDSILTGLLFFTYPAYLTGIAFIVYLSFGHFWWLLVFIFLPLTAWSYVQAKRQF